MIGSMVGRYRIVAELGRGGMGSVWKAEDTLLARTIALKFLSRDLALSDEAKARFLREAQTAAALDHPGIASIHDVGEAEGQPYIAMQLVDGETVAKRVARGALPPAEAVQIATAAAEALAYAHEHGVLHRDVSSRNIMVSRDGRVLVVDFGLALPEGRTRLTQSGVLMGTLAYMAPEVVQRRPADARADLYGLGVVLYEMLTGRPPHVGESEGQILYAIVHEDVEPPSRKQPAIPAELDTIVLGALAKEPSDRYPTARALLADLRAAQAGEVVLGPSDAVTLPIEGVPTRPTSSQRGRVRTRAVDARRVAIAISAVALAAIGWLAWHQRSPRVGDLSVRRIAVLPLRNASEAPEASDHLANGIAEALSAKLTQLPGLQVIPWLTTQRYADLDRPLTDIAAELRVDALLVGSFQMSADRIQVSLSVVDGQSGAQTWADQFEMQRHDLFEVQRQIALGTAKRLRGRLSRTEEQKLAQPAAQSVEAYEMYLKGSAALQHSRRETDDAALVLFERAIQLDPALAEAHVGVGAVYANQWFYGWGGQSSLDKGAANFEKALALRPGLPVAQRGLIGDRFERCRPLEALEMGQQVVSHGTGDIEATMTRGVACVFGGLPGKATRLFEHVIELDPENAGAYFFSTFSYVWAGKLPEAIQRGGETLSKFGDDPEIHLWMGVANHGLGHMEEARAHFTTAIELFPEDSATYVYLFAGHFEHSAGQLSEARRLWDTGARIVQEKLAASPDNTRMKFFLLAYLASLGEAEEAKGLAPSVSGWWAGDCSALGQLGEDEACVSCLEGAMQSQTALVALLIIHYPFSFGLETVARTPGFQQLQEEYTRQVERYEAIY